jgi:hypothetical protein
MLEKKNLCNQVLRNLHELKKYDLKGGGKAIIA